MKKYEIEELTEKINNYFVSNGNPCIVANIELLYSLTRLINRTYGKPIESKCNFYTKSSLSQNKKLIEDFYKKFNINIDIDELISDGTIDLIFNEDSPIFYGEQKYRSREVEVVSNGLIVDSAIMIHELSHLYDLPGDLKRNDANDLLTEAIAFTYEHIFLDYIDDLGYKEDAVTLKRNVLNGLIYLSRTMESIYRLMLVYENFSDIKKDSYYTIFNSTSKYNNDIKTSNKNLSWLSDKSAWYVLALPLYKYMYYKYREKNEFINNIRELQEKIIDGKDMFECLKTIELSDLGCDDKKMLKKYMAKDKRIMKQSL